MESYNVPFLCLQQKPCSKFPDRYYDDHIHVNNNNSIILQAKHTFTTPVLLKVWVETQKFVAKALQLGYEDTAEKAHL